MKKVATETPSASKMLKLLMSHVYLFVSTYMATKKGLTCSNP